MYYIPTVLQVKGRRELAGRGQRGVDTAHSSPPPRRTEQ